jgi:hypothetical protein
MACKGKRDGCAFEPIGTDVGSGEMEGGTNMNWRAEILLGSCLSWLQMEQLYHKPRRKLSLLE